MSLANRICSPVGNTAAAAGDQPYKAPACSITASFAGKSFRRGASLTRRRNWIDLYGEDLFTTSVNRPRALFSRITQRMPSPRATPRDEVHKRTKMLLDGKFFVINSDDETQDFASQQRHGISYLRSPGKSRLLKEHVAVDQKLAKDRWCVSSSFSCSQRLEELARPKVAALSKQSWRARHKCNAELLNLSASAPDLWSPSERSRAEKPVAERTRPQTVVNAASVPHLTSPNLGKQNSAKQTSQQVRPSPAELAHAAGIETRPQHEQTDSAKGAFGDCLIESVKPPAGLSLLPEDGDQFTRVKPGQSTYREKDKITSIESSVDLGTDSHDISGLLNEVSGFIDSCDNEGSAGSSNYESSVARSGFRDPSSDAEEEGESEDEESDLIGAQGESDDEEFEYFSEESEADSSTGTESEEA